MRQFAFVLCLLTAPFACTAEEAINLAPQYTVGQNFEYSTQFAYHMDQKTYPPYEMDMTCTVFLGADVKVSVEKVSKNLSTSLQVKLLNPKIRFSLKGMAAGGFNFGMDFDSTQDQKSTNNPLQFLTQVTDCLENVQFLVVLDADGQVSEVTGFDSLREKIDNMHDLQIPEEIKDQIYTFIDSEMPHQVISSFTSFIPDHPVNVGHSWKKCFDFLPGYEEYWTFSDIQGSTLVLENNCPITKESVAGVMMASSAQVHQIDGKVSNKVILEEGSHIILSAQGDVEMDFQQTVTEPISVKSDSKAKVSILIEKK